MIGGLLSWFGKKIRLTDSAFWTAFIGGESWSGMQVTPETSLKFSAWWAGVRLYSETVGSLPCSFYERDRNGNKVEVRQHDLWTIVHDSPNADQTAMEFWGAKAASMCIVGNGYAEKVMNGAGDVSALQTMPFDTMPYRATPGGPLTYRFNDRGKQEELPEERVFHTRNFGLGGDLGLSPLAYAREALGGALATEKAAAGMFGKGMRGTGFLQAPAGITLDPDQRKSLQEKLIKPLEGPDGEGKTGILEAGFKYQSINIPPKDAEMLLSRRFNVEDVLRFLGVPPILVGHAGEGQTMWGTGMEQIILAWLVLGLRSKLVRLEQSFKKRVLKPEERGRFFIEYNVDGLLRGDAASRGEFYSKLMSVAAINPSIIASKENLPAVPGGDQYFVNTTLIPLQLAGQPRIAPVPVAEPDKKAA